MYVVPPPKGSDSTGGATDGTGVLRTYQTWKGSNIFFLQGRFIFGPDARSLALTIFLIVGPVAAFCVFVARKLMDHFSHHWGISIMVVAVAFTIYVIVLLLLTSGRDPGIVPRNAHPPEPESYDCAEAEAGKTPESRLPRTKDVNVNGVIVRIKYCDTCKLYRPPRCSHCSICNNCVERFDHHCPWVGQCIGMRNYRFFFMFVFSSTLLCIYVFGFCWVYILRIKDHERISVWRAMIKTPASIALIIYSFIAVWFVGGLSVFHLYLISTNQSTYENFRYRYDQRANPYNKGIINNFMEIFCTSIPPSKNKFRALVPKEPGIPPRVVGGSYVGQGMGKAASDIEMGRKPAWDDAVATESEFEEGQLSNNDDLDKDGGLTDLSPDLSRINFSEGTEGRGILHPRRSSWGRRSGNWDLSPEVIAMASGVGQSNRISGLSSGNLVPETRQ
ncbi:probable protein S-acyltransferase 7 [Cornus florida]|uniref:probable protein S-acyltransferase 7 n=1 Tax=Cornus florida TaxID=4283 RepID=UPI00289F3D62|nr:probable protein S-acyltransferase 7 [Cornus florida]